MLICNVVGARPNFMKMAPVINELRIRGFNQILVHTGQHYDEKMSQVFFDELNLPRPEIHLGAGSDTHARQTAQIMMQFETFCFEKKPDLVIVGGDVNSTVAVALVASKLQIPVAHIESGLRSFDRSMPEEINRILTDHLSDLLFTTEQSANENLIREGISKEKIHFVGNCMIDSLHKHLTRALEARPWINFGFEPGGYALLTLHRPSNVDNYEMIASLASVVNEVAANLPVIFPVHPRTRKNIEFWDIHLDEGVRLCEPLPYLNFLGLMASAHFVLTDSGGIQEETTALKIPCLTLRANTERPSTLLLGTNRVVGADRNRILAAVDEILSGGCTKGELPPLWDGCASLRIVDVIAAFFAGNISKKA
jgi:UDP-N-acetylglucosamine 2-epimerase (non-hydrolysing)